MDMMQIRRRVMQSADGIPPIYKRVEYITEVGTGGVVDTGVSGNNDNLRFVFCCEINAVFAYSGLFGNTIDGPTDSWRLITKASTSANGFYLNLNRITSSSNTLSVSSPSDYTNRKLYFDIARSGSSLVTDTSSNTIGADTMSHGELNNTNVGIGNNSTGAGVSNSRRTKWYYFRIYDGTALIRNYVPCYRKSDNKVGFYDTVNHTFNPSTGATEFILPS